jgi:glyoxylase-like metal-dependent hydrolase (beta-lactamase superfamily II)
MDAPVDLEPLAGVAGQLVPLPGHTPGSVVVVVPGAVFVGDLLRGSIVGSGAETHFYVCNIERNRRDVRSLLEGEAHDAQLIFTGHFGPLTREAVLSHFVP